MGQANDLGLKSLSLSLVAGQGHCAAGTIQMEWTGAHSIRRDLSLRGVRTRQERSSIAM